jgi:hypothetical protein
MCINYDSLDLTYVDLELKSLFVVNLFNKLYFLVSSFLIC